jgi:hypothetical protein
MYLLIRRLSLSWAVSDSPDPRNLPLWTFILSAVCHVRVITYKADVQTNKTESVQL